MQRKSFSFASFSLTLESERRIENSDGFSDFLCEKSGDLIVTVDENSMPQPSGEVAFRRRNHVCYIDGDCTKYYSTFFDTASEEEKTYACFVNDSKSATLYIDYPQGLWDSMIFDALNLPALLLKNDTLMLHSSCIEYNGEAILFTAPKQTGKSTQAELWRKYKGATVVNGDRMAIRLENGRLTAYGTPYRGSSRISLNTSLPVRAIVLLSQAKENKINKLNGASAFVAVLQGITADMEMPETAEKVSSLVSEIVQNTDLYSLACVPDETAVEKLNKEIFIEEEI